MENIESKLPEILIRYKTNPKTTGDKYQEYSRLKNNLINEFELINPNEYDEWVYEVCKILGI